MSKVKEAEYKEIKEDMDKPTIASSIDELQVKLKDYREKTEYFRTMAIKAEGALEVLSQLAHNE
tara:strand:+ start:1194 stop:1385 length:192 start_codon:yes stop_codon:yes gene_type:complete